MKSNISEDKLQSQCIAWLKMQYPKLIFCSSLDGIRLTIGQAAKAKRLRSHNGFPDLFIFEPNHQYNALFIEFKKETPFKKDGQLKSDSHLEEQYKMQELLYQKGILAEFCWDLEQFIDIVHDYMG
jgi:hypothetical protein